MGGLVFYHRRPQQLVRAQPLGKIRDSGNGKNFRYPIFPGQGGQSGRYGRRPDLGGNRVIPEPAGLATIL